MTLSGVFEVLGKISEEEQNIWFLTFSFESCQDKDEIIVEIRELVELFKFLAW